MKKYIQNRKYTYSLLVGTLMVLIGCNNEFNQSDLAEVNMEPPIITSVSDALLDNTVQTGVLGGVYYIKGENLASLKSIKYNGMDSGFNPTLVTETLIISQVPQEAPYLNVANKLTVETLYGSAETDFSLLTITGFDEGVVDGANTVTINGGDFTDVDEVLFTSGTEEAGNLEEKEARIIEVTEGALTVEVPDGVVQAFIHVNVNGAVARSKSYGFNYPIFTDEVINDWEIGGWDGTQELSNEIALGSTSIKRESNNWAGLTFTATDTSEDLVIADYSAINFQIYPANENTVKLACGLNDFEAIVEINVTPGQWNSFSIPISDFYPAGTAPTTISRIDFQEFSGGDAPFLFYIDQFGFIE
ncbi:hypothetical protein [Maribacter sp. LLG6340-A2]|uniref:hypothetical protein n=1 Tax=Maribacter sp. LLG6340-A2 TaxID=3160834 RepID=UPI00387050F9